VLHRQGSAHETQHSQNASQTGSSLVEAELPIISCTKLVIRLTGKQTARGCCTARHVREGGGGSHARVPALRQCWKDWLHEPASGKSATDDIKKSRQAHDASTWITTSRRHDMQASIGQAWHARRHGREHTQQSHTSASRFPPHTNPPHWPCYRHSGLTAHLLAPTAVCGQTTPTCNLAKTDNMPATGVRPHADCTTSFWFWFFGWATHHTKLDHQAPSRLKCPGLRA
jgi:hypothetical protein